MAEQPLREPSSLEPEPIHSREFESLVRAGEEYVEARSFEDAIASFTKAIALLDDLRDTYKEARLHSFVGYLEVLIGNTSAARDRFKQAYDKYLQADDELGCADQEANLISLGTDDGYYILQKSRHLVTPF